MKMIEPGDQIEIEAFHKPSFLDDPIQTSKHRVRGTVMVVDHNRLTVIARFATGNNEVTYAAYPMQRITLVEPTAGKYFPEPEPTMADDHAFIHELILMHPTAPGQGRIF